MNASQFHQSISGRRFRKCKYSQDCGADTILRASENRSSGLHFPQCSWKAAAMQLDKRLESYRLGSGLEGSEFHLVGPASQHLSCLSTPDFPARPVRTLVQMAPQRPALPVVAVGSEGFLALCLHHPSRVSTRGPKECRRLD